MKSNRFLTQIKLQILGKSLKSNQTKPKVFINLENQAQTRTKGSSIYEIKTKLKLEETKPKIPFKNQRTKQNWYLLYTYHTRAKCLMINPTWHVKINSEHVMEPIIGSFRKTTGIKKKKKRRHNSSICPHLAHHHYSSLEFGFCTSKVPPLSRPFALKRFLKWRQKM